MRFRTSSFLAASFVIASALSASDARANSKTDAARLFREGQELMKTLHYADACPKFEDSQKLDPQLGTVLNLAFCREKLGSVWLSWLAYRDAELRADAAGNHQRAEFARQHLNEMEKTLPRLTIDCGANQIDDLLVEERVVPGANNGQPFTAEAGHRTFKFRKAGKKPEAMEFMITKQATPQRVHCPELTDEVAVVPPTPPPASTTSPGENPDLQEKPPAPPPPPPQQASRAPIYIALGIGGAGIIAGTIGGILTFNDTGDLKSYCPTGTCTTQMGQAAKSNADRDATISDVGFAVGGVGIALGFVFWMLLPSTKDSAPAKAASAFMPLFFEHGSGASFSGRF